MHCVAYTGTHDNNTAQGWYNDAPFEQEFCRDYLNFSEPDRIMGDDQNNLAVRGKLFRAPYAGL